MRLVECIPPAKVEAASAQRPAASKRHGAASSRWANFGGRHAHYLGCAAWLAEAVSGQTAPDDRASSGIVTCCSAEANAVSAGRKRLGAGPSLEATLPFWSWAPWVLQASPLESRPRELKRGQRYTHYSRGKLILPWNSPDLPKALLLLISSSVVHAMCASLVAPDHGVAIWLRPQLVCCANLHITEPNEALANFYSRAWNTARPAALCCVTCPGQAHRRMRPKADTCLAATAASIDGRDLCFPTLMRKANHCCSARATSLLPRAEAVRPKPQQAKPLPRARATFQKPWKPLPACAYARCRHRGSHHSRHLRIKTVDNRWPPLRRT